MHRYMNISSKLHGAAVELARLRKAGRSSAEMPRRTEPPGLRIGLQQNLERGVPIVKKVKILFLRRWYIMGSAALLAAAAIFYAANYAPCSSRL